ncbi:hypothetical protein [Acetivibrio cellulolyticus]|uniref:hypothetical protein n=1 Tax=Acetivibrio cellulolyticus TaxID=35830 RepID=UPI0001E2F5A9|nr:hypothetical protein [Acetivibrio cellulolyticus]
MKKILVIACAIILVVVIVFSFVISSSERDIEITGEIRHNNGNELPKKEYVMELEITKFDDGNDILFPYAESLGGMVVLSDDFTIPSLGSDGKSEKMAINKLLSSQYMDVSNNKRNLYGFNIPYKAGKYKCKIYFESDDNSELIAIDKACAVYVHTEKKFFKDLSWSKLIPISYIK